MKKKLQSVIFTFFLCITMFGQSKWLSKRDKIVIPFELTHNLIIMEVEVNDTKLNMLLDTGSDKSLLFSFPENDSILFYETRKVKINGLGNGEVLEAIISSNNKFKVRDYLDNNFEILLVTDQNINLVNKLGIPINGIIGSSFFKDYLVEINYQTEKIILHKNAEKIILKKARKYENKEIKLIGNKPYLEITLDINEIESFNIKLLMDTGLGDGLWLFENDSIKCNQRFIIDILGRGLGGDIRGKKSRVETLELNDFKLNDALVSYPDRLSFSQLDVVKGRNGSLGGEIIKRFNWFLDYRNKIFYFTKNKYFKVPFNYNMSGIEVQHGGVTWVSEKLRFNKTGANSKELIYESSYEFKYKFELKPIFQIYSIRENSPAAIAGLKVGDMILSINGKKAYNYTIQKITNLFQSEDGKTIKMQIERDEKVIDVQFKLQKIL